MTNKRGDGGRAFPMAGSCEPNGAGFNYPEYGMSLRDWFAGQIMAALISSRSGPSEEFAATSYGIADAMLAERAKP